MVPSSNNVSNLLSFSQVYPQLSPSCEFLPVTEVVGHFFAGISGHQRGTVLHELVGRLHVFFKKMGCCLLTLANTSNNTHWRPRTTTQDAALTLVWFQYHMDASPGSACEVLRHRVPAYGTSFELDTCNDVRQSLRNCLHDDFSSSLSFFSGIATVLDGYINKHVTYEHFFFLHKI